MALGLLVLPRRTVMKSPYMPPAIQAVGLACVPVADMPPGTTLARKPVAAAVITLSERDDGHRDVTVTCMSDAREMEFPLPVLIDEALIAGAPVILTKTDCDVLTVEAASRRFFVEPKLGSLAKGKNLIDPVAMFGAGIEEAALCRRLGINAPAVADRDVAKWWTREAPGAAESAALVAAAARLILWAHGAAFMQGLPDAFFETLLPLRERLFDLEKERPGVKELVASRPFGRAISFASYYREYRTKRDAGDDDARWVTFEEGLSYV